MSNTIVKHHTVAYRLSTEKRHQQVLEDKYVAQLKALYRNRPGVLYRLIKRKINDAKRKQRKYRKRY